MKPLITFLFFLSFLLLSTALFAQDSLHHTEPDDGMNLFLLSIFTIAFCAMIGAAIIGAMVAVLTIFFIFALIGFGILSTSFAIGLYKRSISAGFKSFLLIVFGSGCTLFGFCFVLALYYLVPLHLPLETILLIGIVSGATGGIVMALTTFTVFQRVLQNLVRKLKSI